MWNQKEDDDQNERILIDIAMCKWLIKKNFQLTTILFIWSISTIFAMVTFLKFGYTFFTVGTSKFRQITRSAFTFVFILFVATIIISVTFFGFGNAESVATFDILVLTCAIIWNSFKNKSCIKKISTLKYLNIQRKNSSLLFKSLCWKKSNTCYIADSPSPIDQYFFEIHNELHSGPENLKKSRPKKTREIK